jgi:hypothetical protein
LRGGIEFGSVPALAQWIWAESALDRREDSYEQLMR